MRYRSTRGGSPEVGFTGALLGGLAPDGGLYVPIEIPALPPGWEEWSYEDAIAGSLRLFGAEDPEWLVAEAARAFSHPAIAPLVTVGGRLVLELFWGPTLSFKDHALQVVARLLARAAGRSTVLVATSGDTGSAAVEACRGNLPIVVLFPEGRVSELQRRQMTTVDDADVTVVAVRGTFDDCQAMVKQAFARRPDLLTVNSINFARVAVQTGYYLHAAARIGGPFRVVVPTGNFGNAYSAWMARQMGAPIESVVVANNANHALADLLGGHEVASRSVVSTVAPAMDIQEPSNLERLPPEARDEFGSGWADDDEITATTAAVHRDHEYLLDPHTAVAWHVGREVAGPQVVVATAHPAKFADVVEAATGRPVELPPRLARLSGLEERHFVIDATTEDLLELLADA